MHIRPETPADHEAVAEVHRLAFGEGHGEVVARLVTALRRDDPGATGFVAEVDGQVAGHVMFTRSLLDAPPRLVDVQVLSPLGVLPAHQRRGIGKTLIAYGIRALQARDEPLVFLEGDPAYYSRYGFTAGADHGFRRPSLRIPEPGFQVLKLPAYESWMTGTLVYLHTFWDHDCVGLRASP